MLEFITHNGGGSCPRCLFVLYEVPVDGVMVDHCTHCRGTFFDPGEVGGIFGPLLDEEVWLDSDLCSSQGPSNLLSPRTGNPMIHHRVFYRKAVEIYRCPDTLGLWVDDQGATTLERMIKEVSQAKISPLADQRPKLGVGTYLLQAFSSIPVEVWHPRRHLPVITLSLIGLCCAVFLLQTLTSDGEGGGLTDVLALHPDFWRGEGLWGIVTHMFTHGGIVHIFGNLFLLYVLGDNVEDELGHGRFLQLYMVSGVVGGLCHLAFQDVGLVGASGAISGVLAAYWLLFPFVRLRMVLFLFPVYMGAGVYFTFWLLFNVVMLWLGAGEVAWLAHLGGFAAGLALALRFRKPAFKAQVSSGA